MLHWTAIDGFEESFAAFDPEALGGSRPGLAAAGDLNVSIQFLVDRDGTVYRLMPETWMARHCIGLNYSSIGVENVGGGDGMDNLTDAQIEANIRLVRYLVGKYPTIQYLIGHMEYLDFEGDPLWLEMDSSYGPRRRTPATVSCPPSEPGLSIWGSRALPDKGERETQCSPIQQPSSSTSPVSSAASSGSPD